MEEVRTYHIDGDQLGKQLHQLLVVDGEPEVEIIHPIDGSQIVTRENYEVMVKSLAEAAAMTPKERERKAKIIRRRMQVKFRTAMITAKIHTVDIDDEENFGKDIDGIEMDIEGMIFMPVNKYISGINTKDRELGCFTDESMKKPPIRILTKEVEEESN